MSEKEASSLSKNAEKVLELVREMSLLELNDLVKAMETEFDITPLAMAAAAPQGATEQAAEEKSEKSAYDVVLESIGDQKIAVIKAVRSINQDLGLKEAKDLVEGAPKTVAENVPTEDAEKAKKTLEEAGAQVSLK